jgi:hypothetical protein
VPGKSAQGSLSKENAALNLMSRDGPREVTVKTGPVSPEVLAKEGFAASQHLDLVKIDVEGFEIEALRGLKQLSFDLLLIEISEERDNGFSIEDLHAIAKDEIGISLRELWTDAQPGTSDTRNVLFAVDLLHT